MNESNFDVFNSMFGDMEVGNTSCTSWEIKLFICGAMRDFNLQLLPKLGNELFSHLLRFYALACAFLMDHTWICHFRLIGLKLEKIERNFLDEAKRS